MSISVTERLVIFAQEWAAKGAPQDSAHEAKRLLLNQLKASVCATDHEAITHLQDWAISAGTPKDCAHVLWLGSEVEPAKAALVNGALFEVLDFHDTYIPCFMHATSAVLPALMAAAEIEGQSGKDVITALALGMEVELAVASMLMPTAYYRGYVPAGLTGGVGAAAACSILAGLDEEQMRNALGIAMCTAFGTYVSVGSMTLSYITGATSQSGYSAYQLAKRGFDAPVTAFEGDKGMFVTHSDEDKEKIELVMDSLGKTWRIHGQSYKTVPTETITHGPIECVLRILETANGRDVERMCFSVQPIVKEIVDERLERFGDPNTELTARFDLCFCAAAAWRRGCFTFAEMQEPAYTDPDILALRSRIELIPDKSRETFDGCSLEVLFTDGSKESCEVEAFLGSPGRRMTDEQLSELFSSVARSVLPEGRCNEILDAVWGLDVAPDIKHLVSLLTLK